MIVDLSWNTQGKIVYGEISDLLIFIFGKISRLSL